MIKINPYSVYNFPVFRGQNGKNAQKPEKPTGICAFHTDDYTAFDTAVVKTFPSGFIKNYLGFTKQDVAKTPANKVKLDQRKGMSVEILDKKHDIVKAFRVNQGHEVSKNTAVLEMWTPMPDNMFSSTVWIKIPIGEKFVKPRAELLVGPMRVARIVLNEKGENIASERDEYSAEDMKRLTDAVKDLIKEAKAEGIDFPYDLVQKFFKGII